MLLSEQSEEWICEYDLQIFQQIDQTANRVRALQKRTCPSFVRRRDGVAKLIAQLNELRQSISRDCLTLLEASAELSAQGMIPID